MQNEPKLPIKVKVPIKIEGSILNLDLKDSEKEKSDICDQTPGTPTFVIQSSPNTIRKGFNIPIESSDNMLAPTNSTLQMPRFPTHSENAILDAVEDFKKLSIMTKGTFFQDSFFENARQLFRNSVRDILQKFGRASPGEDFLGCYRDLRLADKREDTQAVTICEEADQYKVSKIY